MPGRLLAFRDRPSGARHSPPPAVAFKNPFSHDANSVSTASLSIEKDRGVKSKVTEKKDQRDKERGHQSRRNSFNMDALKRHSLVPRRKSSSEHKEGKSPKAKAKSEPARDASIHVKVESSPLLFIGPPSDSHGDNSTGALFSSQLQLTVVVPSISLTAYETRLVCIVRHTRPVEKNCPDCAAKTTELKKWTHIAEPRTYKRGEYSKPLQYLFPGHLPATVHDAPLATVEYRLITTAMQSSGEQIRHDMELEIKRAIPPGGDKTSVRVFPPTNLALSVTLQPIAHPIGELPVRLHIDGATDRSRRDAVLRWRLRRITWKIEETHRATSRACARHASGSGGASSGKDRPRDPVQHCEEVRTIGHADVRGGWKADPEAGSVDLEFRAAVNPFTRPVCDVNAPDVDAEANSSGASSSSGGQLLSVTHALVLELVVAEEWSPKSRHGGALSNSSPTGVARILRAHFALALTERMGMGIAWDQETPPVYADVPPSPPQYKRGDVGELDAESLRELDDAAAPATDDGGLRDSGLRREGIVRRLPEVAPEGEQQQQQQQQLGGGAWTADILEVAGPSNARSDGDGAEREPSPDFQAGTTL